MTGQEPLITLEGVRKTYGGSLAVAIDRLTLRRGQSVALVGRNGSGKSTLLRILGGVSSADAGVIWYHAILSRRRLAYLPQAGGLYTELTLRQNFRLRRRLYGLSEVSLARAWYVDDLGLGPYVDRPVGHLSGGFQRLAALAVTLHVEPRWLLLDEPLGGVDVSGRAVVNQRLAELTRRLDLCVVTSPVAEADVWCDTTILMDKGHIA
jgi:ABC-2 type transport system ATP-binding protein